LCPRNFFNGELLADARSGNLQNDIGVERVPGTQY
jgi:hypothetical protein